MGESQMSVVVTRGSCSALSREATIALAVSCAFVGYGVLMASGGKEPLSAHHRVIIAVAVVIVTRALVRRRNMRLSMEMREHALHDMTSPTPYTAFTDRK